jgi:ABC-type taurine transport system ATPase subunit
MRMSFALELRTVSKRFVAGIPGCLGTVHALREVSLGLRPGEAIGVIGGAGAGKSTLLLCAAGLLAPDTGEVLWFGSPDRGTATHRSTYYFANSLLLTRRARSASSAFHVHLLDGPDAEAVVTESRFAQWIAMRCAGGDAVIIATRAGDAVRGLVPRVMTLRAGRVHGETSPPLPARVAERAPMPAIERQGRPG